MTIVVLHEKPSEYSRRVLLCDLDSVIAWRSIAATFVQRMYLVFNHTLALHTFKSPPPRCATGSPQRQMAMDGKRAVVTRRRHSCHTGMTIIELLVVIAIIGLLVAILIPAVQAAREAGRRITCSNNLHQIGIAMQAYESALSAFPPGAITHRTSDAHMNCNIGGSANVDSFAPWTVLLLPYLERRPESERFRYELPFFGLYHMPAPAHNSSAQLTRCVAYECPSDPNSRSENANTNYFGVQGGGAVPDCTSTPPFDGRVFFYNGLFYNNSHIGFRDVTDGSSNTMAVGETRYLQLKGGGSQSSGLFYGTWASSFWTVGSQGTSSSMPVTLAAAMDAINSVTLNPEHDWTVEHQTRLFGSYHPSGCNFLLADGHVRFLNDAVDLPVYRSLGNRNDGH